MVPDPDPYFNLENVTGERRRLELPVLNVYLVFRNPLGVACLNTPRQVELGVPTLQDEIHVPSTA